MRDMMKAESAKQYLLHYSYYKFLTSKPYNARVLPVREQEQLIETIPLDTKQTIDVVQAEELKQDSRRLTALSEEACISTCLYYTLGYLRFEFGSSYTYHRGIPSARGFYATRLYLLPSKRSQLADGVYRYDGLRHALDIIAKGELNHSLTSLSLEEEEETYHILIASHFLETSITYGSFAYNLCTLEAGHAIAQLHQLVHQLGGEMNITYLFREDQFKRFLPTASEYELPLAVLALRFNRGYITAGMQGQSFKDGRWYRRQRHSYHRQLFMPEQERLSYEAHCQDMLGLIKQVEIASQAELDMLVMRSEERKKTDVQTEAKQQNQMIHSGERYQGEGKVSWQLPELLQASKSRSSGNDRQGMVAQSAPLVGKELLATIRQWDQLQIQLIASEKEYIPYQIYLFVQHVTGLARGIYRLEQSTRDREASLQLIKSIDLSDRLQQISTFSAKQYNMVSIPLYICFTVDFKKIFELYGERGYQLAQLKVGGVAQQLCLLAASKAWFCRPSKSYFEHMVEELLDTPQQMIYQLILGRNRHHYLSIDLQL